MRAGANAGRCPAGEAGQQVATLLARRIVPLFFGLAVVAASGPAHAIADGPDFYRVRGVSATSALNLRAEPSVDAPRIARIPADATCLRNLGCQGGLTFEEFTTLSEADKRRRTEENPRWCKVEYRGTVGWVAGRYLAEAPCP
jgi:hypothetical protein